MPIRAAIVCGIAAVALLAVVAVAKSAIVGGPDTYLCYKAALAKGQPKLPKGLTTSLDDRFAAEQTFAVTRIAGVCSPADRDGSGIIHPAVHLESFAIKAEKGAPKFVKTDVVMQDVFALRTLTVTGRVALLDVTPLALGSTPPAAFATDPTSDPDVNRFTCYKAKLAKGSPKLVAPTPTVSDDILGGSRDVVVKRVTKLCVPVDEDGATPGAETRPDALVCYAVKLVKGSPKFARTTVATHPTPLGGAAVLVASALSELCVPALQPTPTPSPTPTTSATPTTFPTPIVTDPTTTITASPGPSKHVFVTSTTTKGDFGGTAGADGICNARAAAASLPGTYMAWVSVTGDGPSTRFTHASIPYRLVDGTLVANDWTDLTDGTLAHAINRNESGVAIGTSDVWTSTSTSGTPLANDCNDFTSSSASVTATCGTTGSANSPWTDASTPTCSLSLRLYCFEQ